MGPMEDISVGMLAEMCNVQCKQDDWKFRDDPAKREYNIISHHVKTPTQMESMHWKHDFDRKYICGRGGACLTKKEQKKRKKKEQKKEEKKQRKKATSAEETAIVTN